MSLKYPDIDPIFISIGPLEIKWYSLAYIFGILAGAFYIKFLANKAKVSLPTKFIEDFITVSVIGIVIGGRIGYVLLYSSNLSELLFIWRGGMSFHGGFVGFVIAIIILCKKEKVKYWHIFDFAACAAPIGIFLGRIANFINGELFGRITNVSWGMEFPMGGPFLRHPSQIYEAVLEGCLLFIIMNILFFRFYLYKRIKYLSIIFVIMYSFFRFFVEFYRDPDVQIGYIFNYFTMGQVLSLLAFIFGISFFTFFMKSKQ